MGTLIAGGADAGAGSMHEVLIQNIGQLKFTIPSNDHSYKNIEDELNTLKPGGTIYDLIQSLGNIPNLNAELSTVISEFFSNGGDNLTKLRLALVTRACILYIQNGGNKKGMLNSFVDRIRINPCPYTAQELTELYLNIFMKLPIGKHPEMDFTNDEVATFSVQTIFVVKEVIDRIKSNEG